MKYMQMILKLIDFESFNKIIVIYLKQFMKCKETTLYRELQAQGPALLALLTCREISKRKQI